MIDSPYTMIGLGDGGAHYGFICDAAYPSFALTHWVRDGGERAFSLPWMINALTRRPAEWMGLMDRGILRTGYKADLNIIDLDHLTLYRPTAEYDLPANGRRLIQRADGYKATIVSGEITYIDGESTGNFPGRLVRGAQASPVQ